MSEAQTPAVQETKIPAPYTGPTGLSSTITQSDLRLPRVALLQSKSPQVENEGDRYKAGMFIDTLTQDVLPAPVIFTPAFIFKNIIKWKPRDAGGGMLWKTTNPTADQLKEAQWNGSEKPSADQYINVIGTVEGQSVPLIISFCKTSLKTGQDLATLATLSGSVWKYKYELTAVKVAKPKGTYYEMRVRRGAATTPAEQASAIELYENVHTMVDKIDTDYEGATTESTTGAEPLEF